MQIVVQRVKEAQVKIGDKQISHIEQGMLVYVGVEEGDSIDDAGRLAQKLINFRIFEDREGKMNLSVRDGGGSILVVSEFTLVADCQKGTRPGFDHAAPPELARRLVEEFLRFLKEGELRVEEGIFGAKMEISSINDGPVTFCLSSRK